MKLLFVEDERLIRENIAGLIRRTFDLEVLTAENGEERFRLFQSESPDMVLTDIRMPVWDGMELIRRIRSLSESCTITILTAYADFEYAKKAIRYQVNDFLVKPIVAEAVVEMVSSMIEKHENKTRQEQYVEQMTEMRYLHGQQPVPEELKCKSVLLCGYHLVLSNEDREGGFSNLDADLINIALLNLLQEMTTKHPGDWKLLSENHHRYFILFFLPDTPSERVRQEAASAVERMALEVHRAVNDMLGIMTLFSASAPNAYGGIYPTYLALIEKLEYMAAAIPVSMEPPGSMETEAALVADVRRQDAVGIRNGVHVLLENRHPFFHSLRFVYYFYGVLQEELENHGITMQQILDMLPQANTSREAYMDAYSKALCALGDRLNEQDDNQHPIIRNITKLVMKDPTQSIYLKDLAKRFRINPNYLSELFVKEQGITFSNYVTQVKMECAKGLLKDPSKKIYEVAIELGYQDGRYFSQMFKRYVGVSPKDYQSRQ